MRQAFGDGLAQGLAAIEPKQGLRRRVQVGEAQGAIQPQDGGALIFKDSLERGL
jgi:hypothetical protein